MAKVTWGWKPPQYEVLSDGTIRLFYRSEEQKRTVQRTELRPVVNEELPTDEEVYEPSQEELDSVIVREATAMEEIKPEDATTGESTEETTDHIVQENEMVESTEEESIEEPQYEEVVIEEEITEWICDVVYLKNDALLQLIKSDPDGLECQKRILEERIKAYDDSEYVNDLSVGGVHMWLDHNLRTKVRENLESCEREGLTETVLRIGEFSLSVTVEQGWAMYYAVLAYARASWNVTQEHYEAKSAMTDVEECKAFDWTSGYPEKLAF